MTTLSCAQESPKKQATGKIGAVTITIDYGAPSVKGRTIWGELEAYDKVWRAGANDNTTITFSKDVTINGSDLKAGKYGFFIIPKKDGDWTVIFNTKNDAWGAFSYKKEEDAMRTNSTPNFVSKVQEQLQYTIGENTIKFAWNKARLEIYVSEK